MNPGSFRFEHDDAAGLTQQRGFEFPNALGDALPDVA